MNLRHSYDNLHMVHIYSVILGFKDVAYAGSDLNRAQEIFYTHLHQSDRSDITLLRGDTWLLKFKGVSTEQSN